MARPTRPTFVEVSNVKDRSTQMSLTALWNRIALLEQQLEDLRTEVAGIEEGTTTQITQEITQIFNSGGSSGGSGGGYTPGGADVALADGGTGSSLADPGADRILFWDDSAGEVTWLTAGTGLTITDTTIESSGGASGGNITCIIKAADETVNNSTAFQDDDDFSFAVEANKTYLVNLYLRLNGGITPDFKFQWSLPAGATVNWAPIAEGGGGGLNFYWAPKTTTSGSQQALSSSSIALNGSANVPQGNHLVAIIMVGGTAGTATLQWAQNTADASDSIVLANSIMTVVTD